MLDGTGDRGRTWLRPPRPHPRSPRGASRTAPSVALHPVSSDAVFVRLAKFGNVAGDDVEGLARALRAVAGTWPAPVLRTTGVSVTESEPHTVTAQLGGDVDALRDIHGNVNEVARQQRFFLDRRSFRSELVVGSAGGQRRRPGAPHPPGRGGPPRRPFLVAGPRHARPRIVRCVRGDVLGTRRSISRRASRSPAPTAATDPSHVCDLRSSLSIPARRTRHRGDDTREEEPMTEYVLLFPADDEAAWQRGTDADHQVTFDTDAEFARLLRESGGAITGGAALGHSSETRTLRRGPDGPLVTDGPYAETAEQMSGFFLVTCDDHDALVEAAQVLTRAHPVVEIRPVADD